MFNIWTHPKTKAVRLYLAPKLIKPAIAMIGEEWDTKIVKAWLEEASGHWILKVSVKTDNPVPPESVDSLKSIVLGEAGLTGNETWKALVDQAEEKAQEKAAKKTAAEQNKTGASGVATRKQTASSQRKSAPTPAASSRGKEAGRLDVASIKMPGPVTIEIDHRETRLISEILEKHPEITVKRTSLELADFRIEDREGNELLVERKRCQPTESSPDARSDFETSIIVDGRLFDQSERLKFKAANSDHQIIPIVMLEGDVYEHSKGMLVQQVDGAISFLAAVQKISVLSSYGANHSAYLIAKLASHFLDGLYAPVSMHKAKPKALWDQKLYVLESLPGISSGIAEALLERFGSIRAVAKAEEHELASVKGVGPKRSREVFRVLGEL